MSFVKEPPSLRVEDDEETCWAKFDPMREHYENPVENSFMSDSVGGTLPKKYSTYNRRGLQPPTGAVKLYVGKIPVDVTERGLRNIFSPYGSVLCVSIIKNTKKDRRFQFNFGFVTYANIVEAKRAIQGLDNALPYCLHLEFEISQAERQEKELIENFAPVLRGLNLEDTNLPILEGDYSIKENIIYSPALPLENLDLSTVPSSVEALLPHHLYDPQQHCEELYEPYLVWDEGAKEDVIIRIALRHYIFPECIADIQDVPKEESVNMIDKATPVTRDPSVKSFGVKGTRSIKSCVYCQRKVFNSILVCRCGVIYDDIQCQNKHWLQHKPICEAEAQTPEVIDKEKESNEEDEFDKVMQGFKNFYATSGSMLDRTDLIGNGINIIPELWWDSNSGLVVVTNEARVAGLFKMQAFMRTLPDADDSKVEIGQLVGVFVDNIDLYVRGIIAIKTRLGLIGVLVLEHGNFVFVPSVKVLPALTSLRDPACNVLCTVVSRDKKFVMQNNRILYKQLKETTQFRAIEEDNNSLCTVMLNNYLPFPEQIPLVCVTIESKARVILTAFYSTQALYIQPIDMTTRVRFTVMASEVNNWCLKNHVPSQWRPRKNQTVGVRQKNGEYRRGQVIGIASPKKQNKAQSVDKQHYLVSLIDSGNNMKESCDNLVPLPYQFRKDPCYCTKVSLKTTAQLVNPQCFHYLSLLVKKKTPLIVDFVEGDFMKVELTDESGNSVEKHVEALTTPPWHTSQQDVIADPTKTEAVLTLSRLKVPLYPLSQGDKVTLKLINMYDKTYASMLVWSKEENEYVQNVLVPSMKEYCAQLTIQKYNPVSGGFCLAYCRDLSIWCRGHCEKASNVHGHCYVFLVDYGVHAHVPISDIRPCHELFTKHHSIAFIAHIPELEKSELSNDEIMQKYSTHEYKVVEVFDCSEHNTSDRVVLAL